MSGRNATHSPLTSAHGASLTLALHAAGHSDIAHGAALPIALNAQGQVAEWIMLLPATAGSAITTRDGRGPYKFASAQALIEASLNSAAVGLPIDENHATDLAAPNGGPSPARGWIRELAARVDGIYGRVEWNTPGAALMAERAYRFISPVFSHDKAGNIIALLRASLTNTPNLRGMPALNSETTMELLAKLRQILGLADDATEEAVLAKLRESVGGTETATQSIALAAGLPKETPLVSLQAAIKVLKSGASLAPIAKAAGLAETADAVAICAAIETMKSADKNPVIVALQAELGETTKRLNTVLADAAKEKATTYIDAEIRRGRVGLKPLREHYIARHSASAEGAAEVEKEVGAMVILGGNGLPTTPRKIEGDQIALSSEDAHVAKLLGISPKDFAKTLAAENPESV